MRLTCVIGRNMLYGEINKTLYTSVIFNYAESICYRQNDINNWIHFLANITGT